MRQRPTFERLPVRGYQDNPVADALTQYYDEKLVAVGTQVENLYLNLNPDSCPESFLDWLAFMVGMVTPYYDVAWSISVKRKAVKSANDIFMLRGTLPGVKKALNIHNFDYTLYTSDDLKLAFVFGGDTSKFGKRSETTRIVLPLKYNRNGYEFNEANRVSENYTSVANPVLPCYDKFYIGFSVFDDPLF